MSSIPILGLSITKNKILMQNYNFSLTEQNYSEQNT